MEQSPSWLANSHSASQEIIHLLRNLKVLYLVQNSLLLILSWATWNQFTTYNPTSQRSILILSSHLHLWLPSGLFPSSFLTKILYSFLISATYATGPTHLILLDLVTLIILGEACKLQSSSLHSLLQSPANSSLSCLNILLSTLF